MKRPVGGVEHGVNRSLISGFRMRSATGASEIPQLPEQFNKMVEVLQTAVLNAALICNLDLQSCDRSRLDCPRTGVILKADCESRALVGISIG
jgi:hypothetical protein